MNDFTLLWIGGHPENEDCVLLYSNLRLWIQEMPLQSCWAFFFVVCLVLFFFMSSILSGTA